MKRPSLRERLQDGGPLYGLLSPDTDGALVETVGLLGFDLFILDTEHGPGGPREAEGFVRACELVGMAPLVRPRGLDAKLILQYLDAGMQGIMLPGVRSAEDVRQLVRAVKYPPEGLRGIAPVRANRWLLAGESQAAWVARANAETLVLPQVETVEALSGLPEIVKVPGVDGVIIGPRDLSMAMGFHDGPGHPEVEGAIDRITRTALAAGLLVGTVAATGERARALVAQGHRIVLHSVGALLKTGAEAFFAAATGQAGGVPQ
ncbi:MAG TPA: aldolase/citrate lyase family protein [Thermoanaerobaculia bacterium]|nr:aldolase/citrate lyase family protein [Thermoanaerobaculia bacterium]